MKYTEEFVNRLCDYLREGDTQRLACKKAGLSDTTFHEWKNTKPKFAEAVKKAQADFNSKILGELEATLWKKAKGYEVTETESEFTNDKNGKPMQKSKKVKVKHIAPDTAALIFALTNVAPDKWKNRQTQDVKADVKAETNANGRFDIDLPEDVVMRIADEVQQVEHDKLKEEKENE